MTTSATPAFRSPTPFNASNDLAATRLSADSFDTLIDLAGRQRMLSQRIVLFGLLSAQGDPSALTTAQEALDLFRGSHVRLVRSRDQFPFESATALQKAFFGPEGFDAPVRDFIRLAEDTLSAVAGSQPMARRMASSLVGRATPMLALLNDLMQCFESQARQLAQAQRQQLATLMENIRRIAGEARLASVNARVAAAHEGHHGDCADVASVLSGFSQQIERLSHEALASV